MNKAQRVLFESLGTYSIMNDKPCKLKFDKNGTVKQQYIANDYKAIGNYGESQYEYTSNPFYSWFHNIEI